jgi:hypothetical protein
MLHATIKPDQLKTVTPSNPNPMRSSSDDISLLDRYWREAATAHQAQQAAAQERQAQETLHQIAQRRVTFARD